MASDIASIKATLERNTDSLEEHMKRTAAAEMAVTVLKDMSAKIDSRLHPLEEVQKEKAAAFRVWKKIGTIGGAISGIITIVYTIWSFSQGK